MKSLKPLKIKRVSTHGDTKNFIKKPSIIIAGIIVIAVIVSLVVINFSTKAISHGEISSIEKVASVNTSQLFITPASTDWWKFIADTSYSGQELSKIDPITDHSVIKLGYMNAMNTDESTKSGGPLRITYLETDDEAKAIELKTFLESKAGDPMAYNVRIDGNIVAIGPDWAFDQSLYFAKESLGDNQDYVKNTKATARNKNSGYAYLDVNNYLNGLLETKDDKEAKSVLNEYFKYEFGLKDQEVIWTGNASSYNSIWDGKLVKGGIDEKTLDPKKAKDILQGREKVIADNGQELTIDPRESSLLSDVYVYSKSKSPSEDKAPFTEFFAPYKASFDSIGYTEDNSLMHGVINIPVWDSTISDRGLKSENLSTLLFSGKADSLSFTFIRTAR